MAGEREPAGLAIHPEDRDIVAALIAAVEEPGWARRRQGAMIPRSCLANVPSHGNLYVNDNELMMSTAP